MRAHAYMLIEGEEGGGEHGRYLALTKDYQLIYHDASASNATHAWPPRATQAFDPPPPPAPPASVPRLPPHHRPASCLPARRI